MLFKKYDIAVINRSFWPVYPVIGEALLRIAEDLSSANKVCVVVQDHAGLHNCLVKEKRGNGVNFYPVKSLTTSSSSMLLRVLDTFFFAASVFFKLICLRPRKVYISTDPPVIVPSIVMIYSKIFRASYIYHVQDIHPEATKIVVNVNKYLFVFLRWLDSVVVRNADNIITITDQMANELRCRAKHQLSIHVVDNPSVPFGSFEVPQSKVAGFLFCGNAGRLQRIPLLISAIKRYIQAGGCLEFAFAGGGVYSEELKKMSKQYQQIKYFGVVSTQEAVLLNCKYQWALLPIDDEVTRYAFPSKLSSYVFAGAKVLAICGSDTIVANRVSRYSLGAVCEPDERSLVNSFFIVERKDELYREDEDKREEFKLSLDFDCFIERIKKIIMRNA